MYARYIPPAKAKPKPVIQAADGPETTVTSRPAGTSSIAPYARYIPPTKGVATKSTKTVFGDDDAPLPPPKKRRLDDDVVELETTVTNGVKPKKEEEKKEKSPEAAGKEMTNLGGGPAAPSMEGIDGSEGVTKEQRQAERKAKKEQKKTLKRQASPSAGPNGMSTEVSSNEHIVGKLSAVDGAAIPEKDRRERRAKRERKETQEPPGHDQKQGRHKDLLGKFERSVQIAERTELKKDEVEDSAGVAKPAPEDLHGLVPLPQPDPVPLDTSRPTYETLPSWLASPIRVSQQTKASFESLGINAKAAAALASKGYAEAFAVQVATIPLLLPQVDLQGDLAVSAATGSGKTLAYVLPMMQDVSKSGITRLRALIIVPTRELVRQAQEACELCASAFIRGGRKKVAIGVSVGSQSFEKEQDTLMEETQQYDPEGYQEFIRRRNRTDFVEDSDEEADWDIFRPVKEPLPFHVNEHRSSVDVLICTPGRLVDHIRRTKGFTLDYVRWLIVDEADKLLGQSFQQWLDVVMLALSHEKPGARHFVGSNKAGIRKVVLSATMTRDVSLLNELKLNRPKLVLLEGEGQAQDPITASSRDGEHTLPELLEESAIKIRDASLKPLYLLELLKSPIFLPKATTMEGSDEESQSDYFSMSSESDRSLSHQTTPRSRARAARSKLPSALIFTGTNESALRLSRLLAILSPPLSQAIGTLSSATRSSERRKTLQAYAAGKVKLLIASDLVARGMDLPALKNVINYDIPASVASYVHRVGRTARAGQAGHAWTLLENKQAAWFWREIGGEGKDANQAVKRNGRVERVKLSNKETHEAEHFSEDRIREYEKALAQLGSEASEGRKKS
jgi:ATP-dependent RNA helicase DDX51/DBP6